MTTKHLFKVSIEIVEMDDESGFDKKAFPVEPLTVIEEAYSLRDALMRALNRPYGDWFKSLVATEVEEALDTARFLEQMVAGNPEPSESDHDSR
jgi:hypothetical protein